MSRLWMPVIGIILLFVVVWKLPGGLELTVSAQGEAKPLVAFPIDPGERFTLRYIHSVDKSPIWEVHSVDQDGNIFIEEERFVMFGAGMGHWEGHGTLKRQGEYQVIEDIHAPVEDFVLRVGDSSVNHVLIWRDTDVNLSQLVPGKAVVIAVRDCR